MSDKNIHQKIFFASFNNDRGLSLDDKTKDYADRNTEGQKLKYIFTKNYTTIIRTYWATKYESRRENEFGWLAAVCLMHVDISS